MVYAIAYIGYFSHVKYLTIDNDIDIVAVILGQMIDDNDDDDELISYSFFDRLRGYGSTQAIYGPPQYRCSHVSTY